MIWAVQSHRKKFSDFQKSQISLYPRPSTPLEGRIAIVTDAGLDAMDAAALLTNSANADGKDVWSWRPDAGVKFVRHVSQAMVARKPGHQGERVISRKPLRGDAGRSPVNSL